MQDETVIGAFRLRARIGRGGMGEVWRADHVATGTPVAVKLLTSERARNPGFADAFRREARAVAGLSHRAIIDVFDFGAVGEGAPVPPGSPWLAMEHAADGTLASRVGLVTWPELRATLLELLDALAHAHARGIVHLDLKPSNVLLKGGPKLADFGISFWSEEERQPVGITGTPAFMAPEQVDGRWRDFGPWTDLYALGGVTVTLVTGSSPWGAARSGPGARTTGLPDDAPPWLGEWVGRLLDAEPSRRFERASEAAAALRELPEAWSGPLSRRPVAAASAATLTASSWSPAAPLPFPPPPAAALASTTLRAPTTTGSRRDVLITPDWRRPGGSRSPSLHGVGLGLYGLRAVPFVGRERERDVAWAALRDVVDRRRACAVVIEGEAGVGKSRLAQWLARRAHEAGAEVLTARHGDPAGPRDGLAPMLERHLVARDLVRRDVAERVARASRDLDATSVAAITEVVRPLADREAPLPGERPLATAEDRLDAVCRYVEALAARRPVVLWLDDAQWGADACRLAARMCGRPAPVLILVTARAEALAGRPEERRILHGLDADRIALGGLGDGERRELVRSLLGLTGDLAARVEERSAGNPLFAVQLVGDWVRRGVLSLRDGGFDVAAGADASVPDAIHALWMRRIDDLLADRPSDLAALELAGVLGAQVETSEWADACRRAGTGAPDGLLAELRLRGLAVERDAGTWSFCHGLLAESLVRSAREGGRFAGWSRHAGEAVLERAKETARQGRYRAAIPGVERAAALLDGHFRPWAHAMMTLYTLRHDRRPELLRRVLERAQAEGADDVSGGVHRHLGFEAEAAGDIEVARRHLALSITLCERGGDTKALGRSLNGLAAVEQRQGRYAEAERLFREALPLRERAGDDGGVTGTAINLSRIHRLTGRLAESEAFARRAEVLARASGDVTAMGGALLALAHVRWEQGRFAEGHALADEAAQILARCEDPRAALAPQALADAFLDVGDAPSGLSFARRAAESPHKDAFIASPVLLTLGRALRAAGDLEAAENAWRRAHEVAARAQLPVERSLSAAWLAWLALDRGVVDDAQTLADEAIRFAEATESSEACVVAYTVAAAVARRRGDAEEARARCARAHELRRWARGEVARLLDHVSRAVGTPSVGAGSTGSLS